VEWFGWIWKGNTWQRVTDPHATLSECSRALSRIGKARRVPERANKYPGFQLGHESQRVKGHVE
jgi:hypothetical protein